MKEVKRMGNIWNILRNVDEKKVVEKKNRKRDTNKNRSRN